MGWKSFAGVAACVAGSVLALYAGNAPAAWKLNMTTGQTPISYSVYSLHMLTLWTVTVIGILVFGVMLWSVIHHRKSKGAQAAHFHHSTLVEIIWTAIPTLILISLAIPATKALVRMEDTTGAKLTIKITGYQWKWHYDYIDDGVSFYSSLALASRAVIYGDPRSQKNYLLEIDKPLVVPVGEKIRFLITGGDVIHSWWVPALGMKKDAIPGFINEMWTQVDQPGTYRGQCAELCGKDHGFMPIVVEAKSQADYKRWLEARKTAQGIKVAAASRHWGDQELMARGKQVYTTACAGCHQENGKGIPGTFPALAGSSIATGSVDAHIDRVLNGKPGTAMAAFAKQLDDVDLAAVISYERNSFGNHTGDTVQPTTIRAAR